MRRLLALVVLWASVAGAFPVSTNEVSVDVTDYKTEFFRIPQGETRYLLFDFQQDGVDLNLTELTADLLYQGGAMTNWASVTGSVVNTNQVLVPWGPDYDLGYLKYSGWLRLRDGSYNPAYRVKVDLAMIKTPGFIVNPVAVDTNLVLNWAQYDSYEGTQDYGPVRVDGTTVSAVTNADGSLTISVGDAFVTTNYDGTVTLSGEFEAASIVLGGLSRTNWPVDGASPTWDSVYNKPFTNLPDLNTNNLTGIDWGALGGGGGGSDLAVPFAIISNRVVTIESWPTSTWTTAYGWGDWESSVTAVSNRVSTNEADIVLLESATNSLNTRVGTAEGDITTLESATNSLNTSVASLNTATNALDGRVTTLEGQTNGYVEVGDTNGWTVTTHTPYVTTNDSRTVALTGALSTTSNLTVTGEATAGSLSTTGNISAGGSVTSTNAFVVANPGFVGESPVTLRIESTANGTFTNAAPWGHLDFYSRDASGSGAGVHGRIGMRVYTPSGSSSDMFISQRNSISGVLTEIITCKADSGSIGFGTNAPNGLFRTHTLGNAFIDGSITNSGTLSVGGAISGASVAATGTVSAEQLTSTDDAYIANRMGIGTANPVDVLDLGSATSGRGLAWGGATGNGNYANIWTTYSAADIILATGMKGATTNNAYLSSSSSTMGRAAIRINAFTGTGGSIEFFTDSDAAVPINDPVTPTVRMTIPRTGEVLINTTTDSGDYKLQVNGNALVSSNILASGSISGASVAATGNITASSNITAGTSMTLGGVTRTNWPTDGSGGADTWYSYPANGNVNMNRYSLTNIAVLGVSNITLGGESRTNWPVAGAGGGDIYAASNNVFTGSINTFSNKIAVASYACETTPTILVGAQTNTIGWEAMEQWLAVTNTTVITFTNAVVDAQSKRAWLRVTGTNSVAWPTDLPHLSWGSAGAPTSLPVSVLLFRPAQSSNISGRVYEYR